MRNSSVTDAGSFYFSLDATANQVSVFSVDASGNATTLPGSPYATAAGPTDFVTTPNGAYLYVRCTGGTTPVISAFTVNTSTGALSAVEGSPFSLPAGASTLCMSPGGAFMFVAESSTHKRIHTLTINSSTGVVGSGPTPATVADIGDLCLSTSGAFLYVNGNTKISALQVNSASGALTAVSGSPFTKPSGRVAGGLAIKAGSAGDILVAAGARAKAVQSYTVNAQTGALTACGSAQSLGAAPVSLALSPDCSKLFVSCFGPATGPSLSALLVHPGTGALVPAVIPSYSFDWGSNNWVLQASRMVVSPDNSTLYLASTQGDVSVCHVGPEKALLVSVGKVTCAGAVTAIHFSGTYACVSDNSGALSVVGITPSSLNPVNDSPIGQDQAICMCMTPDGQYLYVLNAGMSISAYSVDGGTLTALPGSGYPAENVGTIYMSQDGSMLFAAYYQSVAVYAIGADGSLTVSANSPYPTQVDGQNASVVGIADNGDGLIYISTMDPSAQQVYTYDAANGGQLTLTGSFSGAGSPSALLLSSDVPDYLFCANSSAANIITYNVAGDNANAPVETSSVPILDMPWDMVMAPDLRSMYALSYSPPQVYGYALDATTGVLTPADTTPVTLSGDQVNQVVVTPDSRYAFVSYEKLGVYRAVDGNLSALEGSPFTLPASPFVLALSADGKYLFVGFGQMEQQYGIRVYTLTPEAATTISHAS